MQGQAAIAIAELALFRLSGCRGCRLIGIVWVLIGAAVDHQASLAIAGGSMLADLGAGHGVTGTAAAGRRREAASWSIPSGQTRAAVQASWLSRLAPWIRVSD